MMDKPKEPNPFDEVEPSTYTFRVRLELDTEYGIQYTSLVIEKALSYKYDITDEKVEVSEIKWYKAENTSYVKVLVGPIKTERRIHDLEAKTHVGLEDDIDVIKEVKNVNCVDIIP